MHHHNVLTAPPDQPTAKRAVQDLLVRAAIDLTPRWLRTILALNGYRLHAWEREVAQHIGALADRLVLESNPAVQACRRLRLPADYLYANRSTLFRPNAALHENR